MSNAPCLYKDERGNKCWLPVSPRGGYCYNHQPKAFGNVNHGNSLPKNWAYLVKTVLRRDKGICYRCGKPGADSADHVKPRALGGSHSLSNLKAIHHNVPPRCHDKKTLEDAAEAKRLNMNAPRKPVKLSDLPGVDF